MNRYSKATLLMALLLAAALLLCACGSVSSSGKYSASKSNQHMEEGNISFTYANFNGNRTYSFTLKQGAVLKINVTTQGGDMSMVVSGPGIALAEESVSGEYTVTAEKEGACSVTFNGTDHQGGYTITW